MPAFAALYIFSLAKKNSVRRYRGCVKIKLIKATGITASFSLTMMSHYRLNTMDYEFLGFRVYFGKHDALSFHEESVSSS